MPNAVAQNRTEALLDSWDREWPILSRFRRKGGVLPGVLRSFKVERAMKNASFPQVVRTSSSD